MNKSQEIPDEYLLVVWRDPARILLEGHFVCLKKEYNQWVEEMKSTEEIKYNLGGDEVQYRDGIQALETFSADPIEYTEVMTLIRLGITTEGFTGPNTSVLISNFNEIIPKNPKNPKNPKKETLPDKVSILLDIEDYIPETERLVREGYVKTYVGKRGETWERLQNDPNK